MADTGIDIDALCVPFEGDVSAGVDARADSSGEAPYFKLKDARSAARDAERQAAAGDDAAELEALGHWRQILNDAPGSFVDHSKDLEVACWYMEALLRLQGFPGLLDGIKLVAALVEKFWDEGLYPQEDEDGIETRVAPLAGLNGLDGAGALIRPIKMSPITDTDDPGPFAYWQYEQALQINKITDSTKKQARISGGGVTYEDFEASINQSSVEFLKQTYQAVKDGSAEFGKLVALLRDKAGDEAPPSSAIVESLDNIGKCLESLARHMIIEEEETGEAEPGEAKGAAKAKGEAPAISGREEALRTLLKTAEYFERAEPQSNIALTLRELVRRARMSLPDLLEELIPDQTARDQYMIRLGARPITKDG